MCAMRSLGLVALRGFLSDRHPWYRAFYVEPIRNLLWWEMKVIECCHLTRSVCITGDIWYQTDRTLD